MNIDKVLLEIERILDNITFVCNVEPDEDSDDLASFYTQTADVIEDNLYDLRNAINSIGRVNEVCGKKKVKKACKGKSCRESKLNEREERSKFYGVPELDLIWNGTQSDPGVVLNDEYYINYYDLEDMLYDEFEEMLYDEFEADGFDGNDEESFRNFVKEKAVDDAWEIVNVCIPENITIDWLIDTNQEDIIDELKWNMAYDDDGYANCDPRDITDDDLLNKYSGINFTPDDFSSWIKC